jgi:hypothetical protein
MMHLLAFSDNLFDVFNDKNGKFYEIDSIVNEYKDKNGITNKGLKSPNLVKYARKYFNCPWLTYVPLENDGD